MIDLCGDEQNPGVTGRSCLRAVGGARTDSVEVRASATLRGVAL